ncbi:ribosomal protein S5 domain 2-type protein [Mycotypha africana]|uniref:ribosomal protein S5 domain 2-type protein n=1 Tax=Mycotypha africana TaxID=64632 RepID=UPI00230064AB|nr:ribosomal protein S5 domain 2-type protein [Mycotypha africana]KAI8973540.1 ribosomal protein S5 domain 2-type protein [Mycotypha africana]
MDRRRVNGPEQSVEPIYKKLEEAVDILNSERKRLDERSTEDHRPIFLRTGLVTQANGSAYIEIGNTKVTCAVYGPRQLKKSDFSNLCKINCDFKFSPFSCKKRRGNIRDAEEREFSNIVVEAVTPAVRVELLPKSAIDIYINVLENDGTTSCLAAAIIAASVSLADAGIEMFDQVTACSTVLATKDEQQLILTDGTEKEELQKDGSVLLSYMPSLNEITHVLQTGQSDPAISTKAIEQCIDGCSKIYSVMSDSLLQSLSR